jgi:hypothetical protein
MRRMTLPETASLMRKAIEDLERAGVSVPKALLQAQHALLTHNQVIIARTRARSAQARRLYLVDRGPTKPLVIVFCGLVWWSTAWHALTKPHTTPTMAPTSHTALS